VALPSLWRTDSQYSPGCSIRTMRALAALPRSSSHARDRAGSADPCDVSTVSLGPSVVMMWVAALATSKW
jgi:hypothetical protein